MEIILNANVHSPSWERPSFLASFGMPSLEGFPGRHPANVLGEQDVVDKAPRAMGMDDMELTMFPWAS